MLDTWKGLASLCNHLTAQRNMNCVFNYTLKTSASLSTATFQCVERDPVYKKPRWLSFSLSFQRFLGFLFHFHTESTQRWECDSHFPQTYQLSQMFNFKNNIPQKMFYTVFCNRFPPKSVNFPTGLFGLSCFLLRAKHKLRKRDCSL